MPPPLLMYRRFFSFATEFTASATDEVGTSMMTSTPSRSYHCRAMAAPTSGLFWWSAAMTCTSKAVLLNWRTACCAHTTEPWPVASR